MNKKKKPSGLGRYIFPTRKAIERLLDVNPAKLLDVPLLETPNKREINEFLRIDGIILKNDKN